MPLWPFALTELLEEVTGVGLTKRDGRMLLTEEPVNEEVVEWLLLLDRNITRREGKADSDKEERGKGVTLFNHCWALVIEEGWGREEEEEEEERKVGIWV